MKNNHPLNIDYSGSSGVHFKITSMPEQWRVSHGSADSFQRPEDRQTTAKGEEIPVPASGQFMGDLEKASRRSSRK
jgi:hypothetical protein